LSNKTSDLEDLYSQMSLKYRCLAKLLLKLPNPSIPFLVLKRLPWIEGIFYGILLPIFVLLSGILTFWLFPAATLRFGFPLNIIILLLLPTAVFAVFVRIQLERTMNLWKSVFSSPKEWESSKSIAELIELFKKQQQRSLERKTSKHSERSQTKIKENKKTLH